MVVTRPLWPELSQIIAAPRSKTDRRPSHVSDLRTRLDKHVLPIFGSVRLDRITVVAVEKFRNDLRDRGYAYRTINTILRIMGSVFKLGIKRSQCAKNPLDSVERAVQVAKELKAGEDAIDNSNNTVDLDNVWSPAEVQLLLRAAHPGLERVLFETAYLTGAREGCWPCVGPISICRKKDQARW